MSVYEVINNPIDVKNDAIGECNILNIGYRQIELELLKVFEEHFDKSNFKQTEIDPIEKSVTMFLIYYYSKILNSKYAQLTSVVKQLLYDSTEETIEIGYNETISPKRRYNLNEKNKKRLEEIDIVWDDFRDLSLNIL
jgi:hypothetical protein